MPTSPAQASRHRPLRVVTAALAVLGAAFAGCGSTSLSPTAESSWSPGFAGDVAPGFVRWGAAVRGNGDPIARHERVTDHPLGLRRTFFAWPERATDLVATARADAGAGRVPWVSVKPPTSGFTGPSAWAAVGRGTFDADLDALFRALDGVSGPVWFTFHHEPEGGGDDGNAPDDPGGAPAWGAANRRIAARLDALRAHGVARNVAFAPVLMAWTFDPASGRDPAAWWVGGTWDFVGVDVYQRDRTAAGPASLPGFAAARRFAATRGLDVAVGEWGNRGSGAAAATEMQEFYDMAVASGGAGSGRDSLAQVVGLAYFDSSQHSPTRSWELSGAPLAMFRRLVDDPRSLPAGATGA